MTIIRKFPSINGLRAISILWVIVMHLGEQNDFFKPLEAIHWLRPFMHFIQDGGIGVNVFFVISGFLITSLMIQEELNTAHVSLKRFYMRRVLRIFPAYFFLLTIYGLLQYANYMQLSKASWLTAWTFTKYFNMDLDWQTAHLWSLSVEEHFYILLPLIFISGKNPRKYLIVFLIFLAPLARTFFYLFTDNHWRYEFSIFTRIDAIAIGCFCAIFKDRIVQLLSPHWLKVFYLSIAGLFLLQYLPQAASRVQMDFILIPLGTTIGTIADIFIACIVMFSVFGPQGIWHRMLNLKVLSYIGVLSYSIYLWQEIFIYKTAAWVTHFPQNLIFIFSVSIFSYHIIEKPFLHLKRKFEKK